eukprot:16446625-Heterocapsa_arctica.AAC.1
MQGVSKRFACAGRALLPDPWRARVLQHLNPQTLASGCRFLVGFAVRGVGVLLLLFGLVLRIAVAFRDPKVAE